MRDLSSNIYSDSVEGIHIEYRLPLGDKPVPVIILLHGWTGDEKSMWVFSSRLPNDCLCIAPRGLFNSSMGGYGWYQDGVGQWPELEDFKESITALDTLMQANFVRAHWDRRAISLVGFSQGAALAYGYSVQWSTPIKSIAGLSGFVPNGIQKFIYEKPLLNIPVFVTHGLQDKIVPIERARNGVSVLQELGALVTYCEDEAGHRLSPACFRGLQKFFQLHTA